jgi:hypothetical protein
MVCSYYVRPKHGTYHIRGDFVSPWELCGMYIHIGWIAERDRCELVIFVPWICSCENVFFCVFLRFAAGSRFYMCSLCSNLILAVFLRSPSLSLYLSIWLESHGLWTEVCNGSTVTNNIDGKQSFV